MSSKAKRIDGSVMAFAVALSLSLGVVGKDEAQDSQPTVTAVTGQHTAGTASGPSLQALPNPDLSGMEEVVLEQLRDKRSDLTTLMQRPGVTADQLGQAYGEMGMLYQTYGLQEAAK